MVAFIAVLAAGFGLGSGFGPGTASALSVMGRPAGAVSISLPGDFMPQAIAVDSDTDTAYVSGFADTVQVPGSVEVIDLATDKVTATIKDVGGEGSSIAVDEDSDRVYAYGPDNSVAVIDGATNSVTTSIPLYPFTWNEARNEIAVDAATDVIYVGARGTYGDVVAIDGRTNALVTAVPVPYFGETTGLAVNPATNTVYATSSSSGNSDILVISGASNTITDIISPRIAPEDITVNPGADVYYTLTGDLISAFSGATNAILGTTDFGEETPTSVPVTAANDNEYVVMDHSPEIAQVNRSGTAVTGVIPVNEWGYAAADDVTGTLILATADATVLVIPLRPAAIGGRDSASFTVGQSGRFAVTATGTPAPRVTEQGKLPAGVSLSASGTLRGTPKAGTGGVYPIMITADNGIGGAATERFTLTVDQAPTIISADRATFTPGRRGLFTVRTAAFPVATVSEKGALPAGVRFTAGRNGRAAITGIPAKSSRDKTYVIRLTAHNRVGPAAVQRFSLRVT